MSAIDTLMAIVAMATLGSFVWMELLARRIRKLDAESDAYEEARRDGSAPPAE